QFRIGKVRRQRLLTDRMHGHDLPPAPALGNRMMPDDCLADRPPAEPARRRHRGDVVVRWVVERTTFGVLAGHGLASFGDTGTLRIGCRAAIARPANSGLCPYSPNPIVRSAASSSGNASPAGKPLASSR